MFRWRRNFYRLEDYLRYNYIIHLINNITTRVSMFQHVPLQDNDNNIIQTKVTRKED